MGRLAGLALVAAAALVVLTMAAVSADEFRAFWVDAWGDGFLSQSQVDNLLGVVGDPDSKGTIRNANCNAVVVQVRRRADTCYPSAVGEPYFYSGLTPSNFNALQAMIDAAHDTAGGKQRIEVHCWIVAFATAGGGYTSPVYYQHNNPADADNYWVTLDDSGVETSDKAFDPGHPKCEQYIVDVAMDLVNNFDIDGIHYDYIRFTGANQGYNPNSIARYNARYGLSGQPSASSEQFKQWRRDQVSAVVRKVYARIQASKPWVKQSGAFVTWNPSPTTSTRAGFQATRPYYDVYSDWDSWMQEGIVDMAIPMTYYNLGSSYASDYTKWMNFEKDRKGSRHMVVGPGIYLNSLSNAITALQMTRDASPAGSYAQGFCGYSYRTPYSSGSWSGFASTFTSQVCPTPTDVPPMPWKVSPTKGHISGTVTYQSTGAWADGATVTITGPETRTQICDGTGFYAFIDLTPGVYTVTATKTGYPNAQRSVTVQIGSVTGNMYVTDLVLGATTYPPSISGVGASSITTDSATVSWSTDQAANSQVEYGATTSYGATTPLDSGLVTSHSVSLTGLTPKTLYHYRVISANSNGSTASGDYTFTTNGAPVITNPQATDITSTSAVVTWGTDVPADSRVNYGLSTSYGSQATGAALVITHSVSLTGLSADTTYHFQCVSVNDYGSAQTEDLTFTTSSPSTETVVDNADSGWSNTSSNGNTWNVGSSSAVPKVGTDYLYSSGDGSTTESSTTRKCRWTPELPTTGYYDVYVYYQIGSNRNTSAQYTTYYYGGSVTSAQNQNSTIPNQGGWFLVGENLPFVAGASGYVELTTLTTDTKYVSGDAAKWVLKVVADVTPPSMSYVVDEQYTASTTGLQAWWSGSDPDSGILRYEYAVGVTAGGESIVPWTSAGSATSASIPATLGIGQKYYVSVRAVNGSGVVSSPMSSSGVVVARGIGSIAQTRNYANGETIGLPVRTVTAAFPGAFYIEDANRSSGIRVESNVTVSVGQQVQVYGVLSTLSGERRLVNCKVMTGSIGSAIRPVGITTRFAGGKSPNAYIPIVEAGTGLYNVGLLVRTAGKVTAVVSDGFYIDDGSGLDDGSGSTGLKVWTGASGSAALDAWVKVTGVVSTYSGAEDGIYPRLLATEVAGL